MQCIDEHSLRVHAHQEFFVVFGAFQPLFHIGHGFYRIHVRQVVAQYPHAVQRGLVQQQVVAAGAGCHDVDSREDTLVAEDAVQLELHVTGTLVFF